MKDKKVIYVRVPEIVHKEIKWLAEFKYCTINQWVLQAIVEKAEREKSYLKPGTL